MRAYAGVVAAVAVLPGCLARAVAPAPAAVVLLQASNHPVAVIATEPGRAYAVTVSGMYSYDGKVGLADCGHYDPADATAWSPRTNVTVDGHLATCFEQPFEQSHVYSWTEPGTGYPLVFEISAPQDGADDTGYLVVTVVAS